MEKPTEFQNYNFDPIFAELGVIQKLRGQDEVGRWSINASFCPRLG